MVTGRSYTAHGDVLRKRGRDINMYNRQDYI